MTEDKFQENLNKLISIQNWKLYDYQKDFLNNINNQEFKQFIILSETGTGKSISTFLPFFVHKLSKINKKLIYVAPLKALVNDIYKNLNSLIKNLDININLQKRTGDVSYKVKKNQLFKQPDIILTTPESLAVLFTKKESKEIFLNIDYLIIDELSEIINTKRGDQLILLLSKILNLNNKIKLISSSTHVKNNSYLENWISINGKTKIIRNNFEKKLEINLLYSKKLPNSGHSCDHVLEKIYQILKRNRTIIFVNTRAQAELLFISITKKYKDLKFAIHHGSLSKKIRLETEENMRNNQINAIISTSSLEMGIDWDTISQIINIGTPKGVNRLVQRVGRSNHKYYSVPKAFIVPTNKLEYFECQACINLIKKKKYDLIDEKIGSNDVLCQHLLILSCMYGFESKSLFKEIIKTYPYKNLKYSFFLEIVSFVFDGGYILNNYKKWTKLKKDNRNIYRVNDENNKRNIIMNIGTIVDTSNIRVTLGKKILGDVDQNFLNFIKKGDCFSFSGISVECINISADEIRVKKIKKKTLNVPVYWGGNLSLTKSLTNEILKIFEHNQFENYPSKLQIFLKNQEDKSTLPKQNLVLIESFPYKLGSYLVIYTFRGRQANQTITNLLTRTLSDNGYLPLNYILNDYSLGIFINSKIRDLEEIISIFFNTKFDNLNLMKTHLAKKTFKEISYISGLLPKSSIKKEKNYISSDNIFDTLIKYQPSHILLKITEEEVKKKFSQIGEIKSFFELKYKCVSLKSCSEFAWTLINEKPKLKIQSPI